VADEIFGDIMLVRVERLTLLLGAAGAVWAGWQWGWGGAAGMALGSVLSWINFRWLKGGVRAFSAAATVQPGAPAPRVPIGAYAKFIGRFALLAGAVYVILTRLPLRPVPVFAGLFACAAAVVVTVLYQLLASGVRQVTGGNS
jgi:hypothetical protein